MESMEKKCPVCGNVLKPEEKFCPNCGTHYQPPAAPAADQPTQVLSQEETASPVYDQPTQVLSQEEPAQTYQPVQPNVPPAQPQQPAQAYQPAQANVPPAQSNTPPYQPVQPAQQPYPGQGAGYIPQSGPVGANPAQPGYPGGYIPTPVNGMNPAMNQGATQPQFVPQPPPKKKHTGLIVGLSVGGGVVLLAIIALVLWFFVLGGSGATGGGGSTGGLRPGSVMSSSDTYTTTCDEYIQQYESALSSFTGSTITVEQYDSESSTYAMDYVVLENGVETDVRLCFYGDDYQVMGSESFDTVMIDSWEITNEMSDLVVDSCAAAMLLADDQCSDANTAREQIRQWDQDSGGEDCVETLNGITYEFSYLDSGEFSSLFVADSDGEAYLSGSTGGSGSSGGYSYTSPLGEYVPSEVYTSTGGSLTYREYLEQLVEQNGMDLSSTEAQTAIEQGMDTSFYFHSDGTVDVVLNGGASQEGSFVMSGNWAEVTLDGVTESMEYDGSTDVLTLEDNGVYLVLEYNGM